MVANSRRREMRTEAAYATLFAWAMIVKIALARQCCCLELHFPASPLAQCQGKSRSQSHIQDKHGLTGVIDISLARPSLVGGLVSRIQFVVPPAGRLYQVPLDVFEQGLHVFLAFLCEGVLSQFFGAQRHYSLGG